MSETVLDRAHGSMEAAPEDAGARLRFYERLVDAELFVLLEGPERPRVFPLEEGPVVLAFDREDRLADFVGGGAEVAELTGRRLVPMLAEARLGLGLNLGVAPSSILLPAEAMAWLAGVLAAEPRRLEAVPERVEAPRGAPEALLSALDAKLPGLAGLAAHALLAGARQADGTEGLVLAFADAREGAEPALARAAGEALNFSGLEDVRLDVAFLTSGTPPWERVARVALRFDMPRPEAGSAPAAPGSDPANPPRLR